MDEVSGNQEEVSRSLMWLEWQHPCLYNSSIAVPWRLPVTFLHVLSPALCRGQGLGWSIGGGRSNSLGAVINSGYQHPSLREGMVVVGKQHRFGSSWACRSGKSCHGDSDGERDGECRDQDTQKPMFSGWPGQVRPAGSDGKGSPCLDPRWCLEEIEASGPSQGGASASLSPQLFESWGS